MPGRPDIAIPERGAPYEPIHADRFMDFDGFLEFGDENEHWELVGGLPALPRMRNLGTNRMATGIWMMLEDRLKSRGAPFDVWGYGALVRIDAFNALLPGVLVEPRPAERREWLICDPALVIETSFGREDDRAVLHERRAMFLSPARTPPIAEYLAVVDSGGREQGSDRAPLMNFVPFAGRMYHTASPARRVYRFRPGGRLDRFEGEEPVELVSIGLTLPASAFFLDD